MPGIRAAKKHIAKLLSEPGWRESVDAITDMGLAGINALFSFLPLDARTMHRAAVCMGSSVACLAGREIEPAQNIVRRMMWHMNEDSGNIGWGIPEAFAEVLVASEPLARRYNQILVSYVIELPGSDNYCDNDVLRRSCYWAIGRLAEARPALAAGARPWLTGGLEDRDVACRGMAAWALGKLGPDKMDALLLRRLAESGRGELCPLFDGDRVLEKSVSALARETFEMIDAGWISI
ncbi:MAG: HEAT repeat domain-containing protein [Desulfovibrio sp.]|jgi:hypothetical protein|nr:HEAT repeat domain-containing protein [Desulfovibrio sp.]